MLVRRQTVVRALSYYQLYTNHMERSERYALTTNILRETIIADNYCVTTQLPGQRELIFRTTPYKQATNDFVRSIIFNLSKLS